MGSESLAHAAGELQTQLLGSLEITHRGPSRKVLMQTLRVLADLSVECCKVLSSAKVLQFLQWQVFRANAATSKNNEDKKKTTKIRHTRAFFLKVKVNNFSIF